MADAVVALPVLQLGVTVALLRRVWNATPENRRHQRATLLDSIVRVTHDGFDYAKPLQDLTLAEVEQSIGAVTPKFVVHWYQAGKRGTQVTTFVERRDAEIFAGGKHLYGRPARVDPLTREGV